MDVKNSINLRGKSTPKAAILIPAFNEEQVIGSVIAEIRAEHDFNIYVIDDASTDDTIAVARAAGATVIPLPVQLGAWGATQTGFRYILRHGYDLAISMDADGQHEACSLKTLLEPVTSGAADVSIGACTKRGSLARKIAWIIMRRVSGLSLEDITSGFRVYNRAAIGELASWKATILDYQDVGVLLLLQSRGLKIVDVPVIMQDRTNGRSRIFRSWAMVIYYMLHTLLLGLTKRQLARTYRKPRALS